VLHEQTTTNLLFLQVSTFTPRHLGRVNRVTEQSWCLPGWRDLTAFVFISTCWVPAWDLWKSTRIQVRPTPRYFPSTVTKEIGGIWRRLPWRVPNNFRWWWNVYSTKFSLLQRCSRLMKKKNSLCDKQERVNAWTRGDPRVWHKVTTVLKLFELLTIRSVYSRLIVPLGSPGGKCSCDSKNYTPHSSQVANLSRQQSSDNHKLFRCAKMAIFFRLIVSITIMIGSPRAYLSNWVSNYRYIFINNVLYLDTYANLTSVMGALIASILMFSTAFRTCGKHYWFFR